jgi:hypothetical protein
MLKRVEGGYIFQPPPSIFHRTQAYRVNEAQKAEFLALVEVEKRRWMTWLTRIALAVAVATGIAFHQAAGESLGQSSLVGFSVLFIAQMIATSVAYYAVVRRLQPLLTGLPRSDEQLYPVPITFRKPVRRWAGFFFALFAPMLGYVLLLHPNVLPIIVVWILAVVLLCLAFGPFVAAAFNLHRPRRDQADARER